MNDRDALLKLAEAATKGPWKGPCEPDSNFQKDKLTVKTMEGEVEAGHEALAWYNKMTEKKQVQRRSVCDTIYRAMIGES